MRVAVVGAGPSGIYCTEALVAYPEVDIDVFDALPVPFGLVRYGVAPDHFSIRSVRDKLAETFENPRVRFRGNVEVGKDISTAELSEWYDAVIYTYGASADRTLGIPGEDAPTSIAATEFVKWYTGHPDARDFGDLLKSSRSVVVIGLGNVAVDVARLLLKPLDQLSETDMPEHVLRSFDSSAVLDVHIVGRRGPQHATFTTKELKELGEIPETTVIIDSSDLPSDDLAASAGNRVVERNLKVLKEWAEQDQAESKKRLHFHFYSTPLEFDSEQHLLRVERMSLGPDLTIQASGEYVEIPADLVIRSVGYRGVGIEGLPFDHERSVVVSSEGKVDSLPNSFVAGWIKRGPSGIIGTNKKDAVATVEKLMASLAESPNSSNSSKSADEIDLLLKDRGVETIDFDGWLKIDAAEKSLGASFGRERTTIHERDALMKIGLGD